MNGGITNLSCQKWLESSSPLVSNPRSLRTPQSSKASSAMHSRSSEQGQAANPKHLNCKRTLPLVGRIQILQMPQIVRRHSQGQYWYGGTSGGTVPFEILWNPLNIYLNRSKFAVVYTCRWVLNKSEKVVCEGKVTQAIEVALIRLRLKLCCHVVVFIPYMYIFRIFIILYISWWHRRFWAFGLLAGAGS